MIFHPSTKSLLRHIDRDLPAAQLKKMDIHVQRCAQCREKLNTFKDMEAVLTPKKPVPQGLKDYFISNLVEVKRIKQSTCGEIKAIKGVVVICRNGDGEGVEAFSGIGLKRGDMLQVLGNSLALIELNDRSNLYLNKETEIQFPTGNYRLSLLAGELFAMMKPQKQPFEINTPSAMLGVIGTDFDAQITKKNQTILQVLKGKVSFKNESGSVIVKSKHQVAASQYTKPKPTKIKDAKTISTWTSPIKPKKRRGGRIMKNISLLILLLAIVIGGVLYLQSRQRLPQVAPTNRTALRKSPPKEVKPRSTAEKEALQVLRTIQQDMREKNYERIGTYGINTFLSWRDADMVKDYLERELNDNTIGPADYVFKGAPIKFISTGNSVVVVLSEPWHNTTCNLVFARTGDKWVVWDINNLQGMGQFIEVPAKQEMPKVQDTRGMSADQVIRAFYQAMIAKDPDKAVGYLAFPNDESKLQYRNVIRMVLEEGGIREIRQINVSRESALIRFSVTGSFPGLGVAGRADERQSKLYLKNTPTGLKIDMPRSSIFGDRLTDYQ